ncbi:MAG: hypothetical protein A3H93_13620 [Rhodocyclales bacterium RIFCSPLOWO2_02_FULL_63_24]|nr:MAG: hypothetical protein A3H93_13620 [Rhodocyclales bacterium RIFCSPLOWO2_02_FULL_63_24]
MIMMQLELNDQEQEMLTEVLRSFLSEMRTEISHTDSKAYRERLKDQDLLIRQILSRVARA